MLALLSAMSADLEKIATEILRLVAGYDETVVALTTGGPVRMQRWMCKYWSIRRDLLSEGHDVFAALWLRYVLDRYVDRDTDREIVEYVTGTEVYRVIKEESVRFGIGYNPEMKRLEMKFWPANLRMVKAYGNRIVYRLEPCRDDIFVYAVRVFLPTWLICKPGEPDNCPKHRMLTESIKARGVAIDDVADGVYIPLDMSDLVSFLRRVL
jgi:hypothetical protein